MLIVVPKVEILTIRSRDEILKNIERIGRVAYKSEDKITEDSAPKFVKMLVSLKHEAVLEHESITVKFTTNRGVSHEIVRHRLASFCQESTRYCNYSLGKFNEEITILLPSFLQGKLSAGYYRAVIGGEGIWFSETSKRVYGMDELKLIRNTNEEIASGVWDWLNFMLKAEETYKNLLRMGWTAQQARGILPTDLKTEIVMTANLREWKHFLNLRSKGTAGVPHPDMKYLADALNEQLVKILPEVFG